jgi:hypothetical protein
MCQIGKSFGMKTSITGVVVLLAGASVAHCQGTVSFGNYGAFPQGRYIYVSLVLPVPGAGVVSTRLGGSANGPTPTPSDFASEAGNGDDWTVALYGAAGAGAPAASLSPLLDSLTGVPIQANFADGKIDSLAGTWFSTATGIVPGAYAGQAATVQLYAWYNEGGLITSLPSGNGVFVPCGDSLTANVTVGGPFEGGTEPPTFPATLPTGLGNVIIALIPEPSTTALCVMGASAFLLRLRTKR